MSVSPADFELYSRVTGRPMPRSPQEQMAMTPEVFKFTREFGRGQQRQEEPSVIQQIAGTLGNVALAGAGLAGAYGLARALGPETPSKGQIGPEIRHSMSPTLARLP